jgi:hypothetical protein
VRGPPFSHMNCLSQHCSYFSSFSISAAQFILLIRITAENEQFVRLVKIAHKILIQESIISNRKHAHVHEFLRKSNILTLINNIFSHDCSKIRMHWPMGLRRYRLTTRLPYNPVSYINDMIVTWRGYQFRQVGALLSGIKSLIQLVTHSYGSQELRWLANVSRCASLV